MHNNQPLTEAAEEIHAGDLPEIMQTHLDWVYCLCLRTLRNAALAEDVTQSVFMTLARKSHRLSRDANLSGWLFVAARNCCRSELRQENTRRRHELAAARLRPDSAKLSAEAPMRDEEIISMLDQQVARLSHADRTAILLRFYERRSLKQVGAALGISEEAAKKRVQRAVEKLRQRMAGQHIPVRAEILGAILLEKLVQPAPAKLAGNILAHVSNNAAATALSTGHSKLLAKLSLKTMTGGKTALASAGVVLAAALVTAGIAGTLANHNKKPPSAPDKLIVSRATTYITHPLDKDGLPDYKLALKQYLMKGITPTNNAAVPAIEIAMQGFRPYNENIMVVASGPKLIKIAMQGFHPYHGANEFSYKYLGANQLETLGVTPRAGEVPRIYLLGEYFRHHTPQGYDAWPARRLPFGPTTPIWWRAQITEMLFARDFPWRPTQCLLLWAAIEKNVSAIQMMRRASHLPRFYEPHFHLPPIELANLVKASEGQASDDTALKHVVVPIGQDMALLATLRLGQGHPNKSLRYLQALQRLTRLAEQCPDNFDMEMVQGMESHLLYACRALIEQAAPHGHLALRAGNWGRKIPLWPIYSQHLLHCLRLRAMQNLASCYQMGQHPAKSRKLIPHAMPLGIAQLIYAYHPPPGLNWNWQFKKLAATFNRITAEAAAPVYSRQGEELRKWLSAFPNERGEASKDQAYHRLFMAATEGELQDPASAYQVRRCSMLVRVGFAIHAYHATKGRYPSTLAELVPAYLSGPAEDPLNGKPLVYRRTGSGYTLALSKPTWPAGVAMGSGPKQIIVPAPAPTGWQKGPFP